MTFRVKADVDLCQGYGNCVIASPATFDLDEDGLVVVLTDTAPESARAEVEAAARSCPVDAIWLEDE